MDGFQQSSGAHSLELEFATFAGKRAGRDLTRSAEHQDGLRWSARLLAEVGVRGAEYVRVLGEQCICVCLV